MKAGNHLNFYEAYSFPHETPHFSNLQRAQNLIEVMLTRSNKTSVLSLFFSSRPFYRSTDFYESTSKHWARWYPFTYRRAWERAKSKPVSLRRGRDSAVVAEVGNFSDDLTDGRRGVALNVVAAKEGSCEGKQGAACV